MARGRRAPTRPFALIRGVPIDLVRALDRGLEPPVDWRAPVRVVVHSSRDGDRLVPFAEASDYAAALRPIARLFDRAGAGDPGAYPMATPEVLAFVAELRSPGLRELCLVIDNTLSPVWPDELAHAEYLAGVGRAFPGERFVVGWEATGPMVDFAWAFLMRAR